MITEVIHSASLNLRSNIRSRSRFAIAVAVAAVVLFYLVTLVRIPTVNVSVRLAERNDYITFQMHYGVSYDDVRAVDFEQVNNTRFDAQIPKDAFGESNFLRLDFDSRFLYDKIAIETVVFKNPLRSTFTYNLAGNIESIDPANDVLFIEEDGRVYLQSTGPDPFVYLTNLTEIKQGVRDGVSLNVLMAGIIGLILLSAIYLVPHKVAERVLKYVRLTKEELSASTISQQLTIYFLIALPILVLYLRYRGIGGYGASGAALYLFETQIPNPVTIFILTAFCVFVSAVVSKNYNDTLALPGSSVKHTWVFPALLSVVAAIVFVSAIFPNNWMMPDEVHIFTSATGFMNTGQLYKWDFRSDELSDIRYAGTAPVTVLVSIFFRLFGVSVLTGRLPAAIAGVLMVISAYYIFRKWFKNPLIAIIACLMIIFNYRYLADTSRIFNTIRHHCWTCLLSLWLMHSIYCAFTHTNKFKGNSKLSVFLNKYCIHIGYSILTVLICIAIYYVQPNGLFILVGAGVTVIILSLQGEAPRFKLLGLIGTLAVVGVLSFMVLYRDSAGEFLPLLVRRFYNYMQFNRENLGYLTDTVVYPFGLVVGTTLAVLGIIYCIRRRKENVIYILLPSWLITVLVLFTWVLDRHHAYRYMAFIFPVSACLQMLGLFYLLSTFKSKSRRVVLAVLCAIIPLQFAANSENIYGEDSNRNSTKFTLAYEYLNRHMDSIELQDPYIYETGIFGWDNYHFQMIDNNPTFEYFYELDRTLDYLTPDNKEGYIMIMGRHWRYVPKSLEDMLLNATDVVMYFDRDNYEFPTFKYTIAEPSDICMKDIDEIRDDPEYLPAISYSASEYNSDEISYYVDIEIPYMEELCASRFFTVTIDAFDGMWYERRSFQCFIPDNGEYGEGSVLAYTLPFTTKYSQYSPEDFIVSGNSYYHNGGGEIGVLSFAFDFDFAHQK